MQKIIFKSLGVATLLPFITNAQTNDPQKISTQELSGRINAVTSAVPFLMIAPDSKQGGMGEAGAATPADANSIHWNSAKFSFAEKKAGAAISINPWLKQLVPDIYLYYVSGYSKISKTQAIAGSLRYFSLGNITFTDIGGNTTGQFRPNEFALDLAFSQKLSEVLSVGIAMRYLRSNLTGNYNLGAGQATRPAQGAAVDIGMYYQSKKFKIDGKKAIATGGLAITNVGNRISYSNTKNYIPINLRLGGGLKMNLDNYNTIGFYADANKLLVPSTPVYKYELDANGNPTANIEKDANGQNIIAYGKDPNVPVAKGMLQSFSDAPGGGKEELKEINYSAGFEYWYNKIFAIRAGYFNEAKTKGNRKFFTLGLGVRYNVFGLDMAYLIPVTQRNPLQNTLRFTLSFDFDSFKSQTAETPKTTE